MHTAGGGQRGQVQNIWNLREPLCLPDACEVSDTGRGRGAEPGVCHTKNVAGWSALRLRKACKTWAKMRRDHYAKVVKKVAEWSEVAEWSDRRAGQPHYRSAW